MNKAEKEPTFCVLVVDDDPIIQHAERAILEHCGCRVDISGSGSEAVDAFTRKRYDLIFMDCNLPGMDGYETTGVIREMENSNRGTIGASRVPIVALTGYSTEADRKRCLQAGMDDYLSKPFRISQIQSVLDRWLPARPANNTPATINANTVIPAKAGIQDRTGCLIKSGMTTFDMFPCRSNHREDRGAQDPPCMEAQKVTANGPDRQEEPPPIDRNALDMIASLRQPGAENILRKLISLYLDGSPALLKSIREAVEGSDADLLRRAAHTLKSSSASLGALAFSGICKELEMMGRDKTLAGAKDRLAALEQEYERVRESLERYCASLP